jgi:hypothetical protein
MYDAECVSKPISCTIRNIPIAMAHQVLSMTEFNEINDQIRTEKSRTVKIFLLKYKCIFLFTFAFLSFGQFIYIMLDKLSKDGDLNSSLRKLSVSLSTMKSVFGTKNNTINVKTFDYEMNEK